MENVSSITASSSFVPQEELTDPKDQTASSTKVDNVVASTLDVLEASGKPLRASAAGNKLRVDLVMVPSEKTKKTKQAAHSSGLQVETKDKPSTSRAKEADSEGKMPVTGLLESFEKEKVPHKTKEDLIEASGMLQVILKHSAAKVTLLNLQQKSDSPPYTYFNGEALSPEVLNSKEYLEATDVLSSLAQSVIEADQRFGALIFDRFQAVQSAFKEVKSALSEKKGDTELEFLISKLLVVILNSKFGDVVHAAEELRLSRLDLYDQMKNIKEVITWIASLKAELSQICRERPKEPRNWQEGASTRTINSKVKAIEEIIDTPRAVSER